jgi:hypothetical protein
MVAEKRKVLSLPKRQDAKFEAGRQRLLRAIEKKRAIAERERAERIARGKFTLGDLLGDDVVRTLRRAVSR